MMWLLNNFYRLYVKLSILSIRLFCVYIFSKIQLQCKYLILISYFISIYSFEINISTLFIYGRVFICDLYCLFWICFFGFCVLIWFDFFSISDIIYDFKFIVCNYFFLASQYLFFCVSCFCHCCNGIVLTYTVYTLIFSFVCLCYHWFWRPFKSNVNEGDVFYDGIIQCWQQQYWQKQQHKQSTRQQNKIETIDTNILINNVKKNFAIARKLLMTLIKYYYI